MSVPLVSLHDSWSMFLHDISNRLPSQRDFNMWFRPIEPLRLEQNTLTVRVPSEVYYHRWEEDFLSAVTESIHAVFGDHVGLEYQVAGGSDRILGEEQQYSDPTVNTSVAVNPSGFHTNLSPSLTIDNFYESKCNRLVHAAACSIIEKPSSNPFNPLFIYGASGVGKTHALHAIGNEILRLNPSFRVIYVAASTFKSQYVHAANRLRRPEEFIQFYQNIDVLLLDDIQEFKDAVATQNTFFTIFNKLRSLGKQIVITSDRPPVELNNMEERLYTRMKWGLTAEIERPDEDLRRRILAEKLHESGAKLPQDVFEYIVKHTPDNVRDIEGALTSLLAHSLTSHNMKMDIALAHKVLTQMVVVDEEARNKKKTLQEILSIVAVYYKVPIDEIKGRKRKQEFALPRQVAVYLAKEYADSTYAQIGHELDGRDHTTILHSYKTVEGLIETSVKTRKEIEDICQQYQLC